MGHKPGQNRPKGGSVERPPFGTKAPCVLAAYYPAGTHEVEEFKTKKKKMQDKIILAWELDLPNSKGEQFRIFEVQTDSFYLLARLRLRIEALLGKKMTDDEADDFDMDNALGLCGMMTMTADEGKGGPYIEKVDELQDKSVKVAVRSEYDALPRYVKKVLSGAEEGTSPGTFGAIIDGEVFFGNLPATEEEAPNEDDAAPESSDTSGDPDIPF